MRLGVLADTHDNLPKIEEAVRFFNRSKVDSVMHAGDYVAPFAAERLRNLSCEFYGVFGNNDGEKNGLTKVFRGRIKPAPLRINLGNRRIVLVHDINSINLVSEQGELVIFGHTHKPEVSQRDSLLLVNPGDCSGWLSKRSSVAIIDLDTLSPEIFYL